MGLSLISLRTPEAPKSEKMQEKKKTIRESKKEVREGKVKLSERERRRGGGTNKKLTKTWVCLREGCVRIRDEVINPNDG